MSSNPVLRVRMTNSSWLRFLTRPLSTTFLTQTIFTSNTFLLSYLLAFLLAIRSSLSRSFCVNLTTSSLSTNLVAPPNNKHMYLSNFSKIFCFPACSSSSSTSSLGKSWISELRFLERSESRKGWSLLGKKSLGAEAKKGKVRMN